PYTVYRLYQNHVRIVPEPYLHRTCSVHSPLRGTSDRRKYGVGTEQVQLRYSLRVIQVVISESVSYGKSW
ncbi:hypothetical protein, partial [Bacteroides cellulosilyticus]|uniref:hypothetical protein n=1 Tax=Bacteroides cellulosilyticus TaxID=246787 RepID=UPI0034A36B25